MPVEMLTAKQAAFEARAVDRERNPPPPRPRPRGLTAQRPSRAPTQQPQSAPIGGGAPALEIFVDEGLRPVTAPSTTGPTSGRFPVFHLHAIAATICAQVPPRARQGEHARPDALDRGGAARAQDVCADARVGGLASEAALVASGVAPREKNTTPSSRRRRRPSTSRRRRLRSSTGAGAGRATLRD